ncbi:TlpA family protein disulfide reductase [Desulfobulbus alkaliphilus]|uniref:TlpA family protein disulfide reductase n=1 Tax=Desulfobulbus alkaliphilus TaxID=869814 RepID=UPI001F06B6CD|nr:TlpA disulfide reductase family protein [Desulfobulbus alkaliphilus]
MQALRILGLALVLTVFCTESRGAVPMPAFSLPTAVDGAVVSSKSYEGRALLITFFATWCSSCLHEIPLLKDMHAKFSPHGFTVVALSVDEGGTTAVNRLIKRAGISYPVLMADNKATRDFGGITTVPTSFLVNRDGHVVKKYSGGIVRRILEKDIESVLYR